MAVSVESSLDDQHTARTDSLTLLQILANNSFVSDMA